MNRFLNAAGYFYVAFLTAYVPCNLATAENAKDVLTGMVAALSAVLFALAVMLAPLAEAES